MAWDPNQYLCFTEQRLRPALDLLTRIPDIDANAIADLGCGPGNVTRVLADRWPGADVLGIDSSNEMLGKFETSAPGARFQAADIASWSAERPLDIIYSNAALHWLPDHADLFPRLLAQLRSGGILAVQMPRNFGRPSHTSVERAAVEGPWSQKLSPMLKPPPTLEPGFYYDLLRDITETLDIWETDYIQELDGDNPVAEWTKGTWLRPFLSALTEPDRSGFEAAYRSHVAAAYPKQRNGKTLLPFLRLFIVARKKG